jgi:alkylation response protein AidB-like acyl-CoA dehydrogenase
MAETLAVRRSLPLTDLSEDERLFQEAVRDFAEERVRPLVHKMDEESAIPRALIDACFDLGVMGIEIPEAHGGAGATFFMSILAVEALARVDASLAVLVDVQNTLVNNALLRWGNAEQHARYFPKLASKWVGAYALSEAGSGSDAFALSCRAMDRGDHWELTGRKLWITNAAEADLFIILATVDPAKGYKGITAFLVERSFPGFKVGKKEDKLGIRASQTAEVILEDCRVPMEYLLGGYEKLEKKLARARSGESTGRSSGALATFELTRPLVGASALGIAQAAYEWTLEYLEGKEEEGTPLLEQQRVQQVLAEVATEIEASRLLVWRASWMGRNGVPMTGGQGSMSKLKAGDVAMWATTTLMDLVGPYAQTTDCPLEKFFRDAKIYQLFEGTAQVQRLVISRMQRSDYRGRLEVEDVMEQAPGSSPGDVVRSAAASLSTS